MEFVKGNIYNTDLIGALKEMGFEKGNSIAIKGRECFRTPNGDELHFIKTPEGILIYDALVCKSYGK